MLLVLHGIRKPRNGPKTSIGLSVLTVNVPRPKSNYCYWVSVWLGVIGYWDHHPVEFACCISHWTIGILFTAASNRINWKIMCFISLFDWMPSPSSPNPNGLSWQNVFSFCIFFFGVTVKPAQPNKWLFKSSTSWNLRNVCFKLMNEWIIPQTTIVITHRHYRKQFIHI